MKCFVHNIIETRVTHKTCTVNLTRHFRLVNATICITAFKYDGLYRTFYDRCSTQYFVENSRPTSAKIKATNILRCKLWTQSKHVKHYDNLRISLNEALFSIKPGTRPLFFILIRAKSLHYCDGIKLSDRCRLRCEFTHGEKHLASRATCKTRYRTLSSCISEHSY